MGGQSLVFRADTHLAAIGLEQVTEVLRPLPVEALAGVPPYVKGICVLRGQPVPVIDIGLLLGGRRASGGAHAANWAERFVGVRTGTQTAVLAVDTVLGIRDIPMERLHDLSSVTGSAACTAVGAIGREPLLLLEAGRVIPDSVWDALEAA